jgi:hypothetical protein
MPPVSPGTRLTQRRGIHSFFIAEVDRDKIVLSGRA